MDGRVETEINMSPTCVLLRWRSPAAGMDLKPSRRPPDMERLMPIGVINPLFLLLWSMVGGRT
ncbi:hypothetical protein N657DRAFT_638882 [Parathielavia appendiculata]|uniref:Uncharacterized protein n=1 Tax=Parathielavia appendiculata TaxID=2587402 RepID=A0AAN6U946_9PEZI|nr:hypothetical protein N657DRAFT_638882 [Parathielavia appendiculata]